VTARARRVGADLVLTFPLLASPLVVFPLLAALAGVLVFALPLVL